MLPSIKLPNKIRVKDTGREHEVYTHLIDGSVLIGDEMNPIHIKLGEFEVTEYMVSV